LSQRARHAARRLSASVTPEASSHTAHCERTRTYLDGRGRRGSDRESCQASRPDTAKKAVKKAAAPDAIDLNTAPAAQLKKLGLDEETTKKVMAARPFSAFEFVDRHIPGSR
jgi:DNA uptake protein ComE-like DNA-binding protein